MTFQAVVVGSDGLIVGSDRKIANYLPNLGETQSYPQFDEQCKFIPDGDGPVICAWSGGQGAQKIARKIVLESEPGAGNLEWETYLDHLAAEAQECVLDQVIVVRKNCLDHAVRLTMAQGKRGYAARIEGKMCVGVSAKASFLIEHFSRKIPVSALKRLVILTLNYGVTEFSTYVGDGYDLRIVNKDGVELEHYPVDDERVLEIRKSFDDAVGKVLFPV